MPWQIFTGTGQPSRPTPRTPAWRAIPPPPPWRSGRAEPLPFRTTPPLNEAVNAALHLRRPLLLTGLPGSGKSSLVEVLAAELELGEVLRWHVTSKSTLQDSLYQYDALGRLQDTQVEASRREAARREAAAAGSSSVTSSPLEPDSSVQKFVALGPLGTALASHDRPRALLIDEIDKSDLDLPGDLLNVLERGEFDIPPLVRDAAAQASRTARGADAADIEHVVRGADRQPYPVVGGIVQARHFPVIVFTSNGERTFPPPFLRRCVQFDMPRPRAALLSDIVTAHLGASAAAAQREAIEEFAGRLAANSTLAIDQLLSLVYLTTGEAPPGSATRRSLKALLLTELDSR